MIDILDLKKVYHVGDVDVHALRGVNLSVKRGEFVCVVGPSGSGKSTLFHILGGLTPPTSGEIHIGGRDLPHRRQADPQTSCRIHAFSLPRQGKTCGGGRDRAPRRA